MRCLTLLFFITLRQGLSLDPAHPPERGCLPTELLESVLHCWGSWRVQPGLAFYVAPEYLNSGLTLADELSNFSQGFLDSLLSVLNVLGSHVTGTPYC